MKLAVFDLDYTIWQPEMYQLYGPPKLKPVNSVRQSLSSKILAETKTRQDGMILVDNSGSPMRVFHGASYALSDINKLRAAGHDIRAAIASRTDEPAWARICLEHLVIEDGSTLKDCFDERLIEISGGSKKGHLQRLQRKTGVAFHEIAFFDNENWNIKDVSRSLPGVECFYTPNGMTRESWDLAKRKFGLSSQS